MDLFEVAIKLEQEGIQFYTDLAKKAPDEGFANIFKMLADDEKKFPCPTEEECTSSS